MYIAFDNSYAALPERFYAPAAPTPVRAPRLIRVNHPLASALGLSPEALERAEGVAMGAGNLVPPGAAPVAMAYAGHQFGHFVPQLGDGRAVLLGEVLDPSGRRWDLHLKGAGPTAFSRRGDGRAALGPVLREYVVSEAMASLGIPTTRALMAVATGEPVYRQTPEPGAVLLRVASSHVRVGTFQYFAARRDTPALRLLADHCIARHDPDLTGADAPYAAFLGRVVQRQARLVAQWMSIGFIHGVMNTDNTAVSGETLDFGPCAFMEAYHPHTVFSAIDHGGRYAYGNQFSIAHWNLARLAEALLPLLHPNLDSAIAVAQDILAQYTPAFEGAYLSLFRAKLGLETARDNDADLLQALLSAMQINQADFTLTFRHLADAVEGAGGEASARGLFSDPAAFDDWARSYAARLSVDGDTPPARRAAAMRATNPLYLPRNHQVEAAIRAAVDRDDFSPFHDLVDVLSQPYTTQPGKERYAEPAAPHELVTQTFCGT